MTDRFTFAHLTDAHLPTHGRFRPSELLGKRALSALNWTLHRRKRHIRAVADALRDDVLKLAPDHVAMTGDVVNFGLQREFHIGAEWLRTFGDAEETSWVPGNHESLHPGVEAEMMQTFAPFRGGEAWPWLRRRAMVSFIGVTTSIATPPGYAQGEAGKAQIAGLRDLLAAEKGRFRVIMIHHPPTDMSKPSKSLRDREAVCAAISESGAELVLHGHNHKNEMSWITDVMGDRIPVLGAPSASAPFGHGVPAEWRLMTVEQGENAFRLHVRRRAINASGQFEDVGRFAFERPG